jgi:hypothetical protein
LLVLSPTGEHQVGHYLGKGSFRLRFCAVVWFLLNLLAHERCSQTRDLPEPRSTLKSGPVWPPKRLLSTLGSHLRKSRRAWQSSRMDARVVASGYPCGRKQPPPRVSERQNPSKRRKKLHTALRLTLPVGRGPDPRKRRVQLTSGLQRRQALAEQRIPISSPLRLA